MDDQDYSTSARATALSMARKSDDSFHGRLLAAATSTAQVEPGLRAARGAGGSARSGKGKGYISKAESSSCIGGGRVPRAGYRRLKARRPQAALGPEGLCQERPHMAGKVWCASDQLPHLKGSPPITLCVSGQLPHSKGTRGEESCPRHQRAL